MLQTLKLLLPALIPSWRFFDTIAPSPRIEFTLLKTEQETPEHWQEFRPKTAQLPISSMLKRIFWNPRWNETLFLVSCAERLIENPTEHSQQEILKRIKTELKHNDTAMKRISFLQFRLALISREDTQLQKDIIFISPMHRLFENTKS